MMMCLHTQAHRVKEKQLVDNRLFKNYCSAPPNLSCSNNTSVTNGWISVNYGKLAAEIIIWWWCVPVTLWGKKYINMYKRLLSKNCTAINVMSGDPSLYHWFSMTLTSFISSTSLFRERLLATFLDMNTKKNFSSVTERLTFYRPLKSCWGNVWQMHKNVRILLKIYWRLAKYYFLAVK